jgi:hypothetical protein
MRGEDNGVARLEGDQRFIDGAPEGSVDGITQLTLEATSELMHSKDVSLILATAWWISALRSINAGPLPGPPLMVGVPDA